MRRRPDALLTQLRGSWLPLRTITSWGHNGEYSNCWLSWYGFLQEQGPLHSHVVTLLALITEKVWLNEQSMSLKTEDPLNNIFVSE